MRFGGDFSTSTRRRHVPVRAPVGGEPRAVLVGDERRVLGQVRARVETEPAGAAVGARGPVDGLEVLPLVLGDAGVAKAARVGMLGRHRCRSDVPLRCSPPTKTRVLPSNGARHTGTSACRPASRRSLVEGSGSRTRAISR